MAGIQHTFGADLTLSPTGDIAFVDSSIHGQERVLRRLLTNPGDYIWQRPYGAGLPAMIGAPANTARISAIVRGQIMADGVVAADPAPVIETTVNPNGTVYTYIRYSDAKTGETVTLTLPAGQ